VRAGDWKLIRFFHDNPDQTDRFELYNLREDIGEKMNLAGKMPEKVEELNRMMDGFLKDTQAILPKPNPAYRGGDNPNEQAE
jgi:arylsulfatase A-like enzyme